MKLDEIKKEIDLKFPKNKGFFIFGSYVYGSTKSHSDVDVVIIQDDLNGHTTKFKNIDAQFVSESLFKSQLNNCEIKALEGYFCDYKYFKFELKPKIDWTKLRASISQKSSHSWVKAKKKLEVDHETLIGQKSLFHSLRIMDLGIQLATTKTISNFSASNHYLDDIMKYYTWAELKEKYQPIYNNLHSEFKKVCLK